LYRITTLQIHPHSYPKPGTCNRLGTQRLLLGRQLDTNRIRGLTYLTSRQNHIRPFLDRLSTGLLDLTPAQLDTNRPKRRRHEHLHRRRLDALWLQHQSVRVHTFDRNRSLDQRHHVDVHHLRLTALDLQTQPTKRLCPLKKTRQLKMIRTRPVHLLPDRIEDKPKSAIRHTTTTKLTLKSLKRRMRTRQRQLHIHLGSPAKADPQTRLGRLLDNDHRRPIRHRLIQCQIRPDPDQYRQEHHDRNLARLGSFRRHRRL